MVEVLLRSRIEGKNRLRRLRRRIRFVGFRRAIGIGRHGWLPGLWRPRGRWLCWVRMTGRKLGIRDAHLGWIRVHAPTLRRSRERRNPLVAAGRRRILGGYFSTSHRCNAAGAATSLNFTVSFQGEPPSTCTKCRRHPGIDPECLAGTWTIAAGSRPGAGLRTSSTGRMPQGSIPISLRTLASAQPSPGS